MICKKQIVIASLLVLTQVSCKNEAASEFEGEEQIFTDSLELSQFKEFIYSYYDRPLAISDGVLDRYLNDHLLFHSLSTRNKFGYDLEDYRVDSLLARTLSITPLPAYEPHIIRASDTSLIMRIYVDKRVFGRKDIELLSIEQKGDSYNLLRAEIEMEPKCFQSYPRKYQDSCIQVLSQQTLTLSSKEYEKISKTYYGLDLGRITYYDHQSRMICDGFSYQLRRLANGSDKMTGISCPGDKSAIVVFYEDVKAYFLN